MLPFTTVVGVDEAAETSVQLRSLPEVVSAEDLASKGLHSQAVPLLERAADICSAMGSESALARAARRRQVRCKPRHAQSLAL